VNILEITTAKNPYESGEDIVRAFEHYEAACDLGYIKPVESGPYLRDGHIVLFFIPSYNRLFDVVFDLE
jgi:hypothetical protein